MNDPLVPLIAFAVSGVLSTISQGLHFGELAKHPGHVRADADVARQIRDVPSALPRVVATETGIRLRALLTVQTTRRLELLRWIALCSIAVSLLVFAWVLVLFNA